MKLVLTNFSLKRQYITPPRNEVKTTNPYFIIFKNNQFEYVEYDCQIEISTKEFFIQLLDNICSENEYGTRLRDSVKTTNAYSQI